MQVVLVYLDWFWCNSLLNCLLQPKIAEKNSLKPLFWGSRSFKVIDVGTTGKLVGSACYDNQQVCVYLQPFFTLDESMVVKELFLRRGTPLWCRRSRRISSPSGTKIT